MTPFSDEYATLPDYILGITERIWEGREIGLIRRYYAPDVIMHTQAGWAEGVEPVVSGTLETLHAFPDRVLLGEDVIHGPEQPGRGVLSSHRIVSHQTHQGDGAFGPATGRRATARTVADCRVVGDVIVEEWLVRDQGAIARQLGLDPREIGLRLAEGDAARRRRPWHMEAWNQVRAGVPEAGAVIDDHPAAGLVAALLHDLFADDLAAIRRDTNRALEAYLPGGVQGSGWDALERFAFALRAALPDAAVVVDRAVALLEPGRPARVALRFRAAGTHAGPGWLGPPSGARVLMLGIWHAEVWEGRIGRLWWLADEVGLHRMIGLQSG